MKALKKTLTALLVIAVILTAIFLAGRYGWKLGGFRACQGAGVTSVEVSEKAVHITGFYPGSFPEGCCGYYAKEQDNKLYVGFRFSNLFGFFETGDFDITIPVKGEINEVILKTSMNETSVWNAQAGSISQSEQYGVYVKLERNDVYSVSMSYDGFSGGVRCADYTAMDSGEYCFMDNDIMMASKEADASVPFTITVKDADGTVVASGEFSFDANMEKMYLTVTADNKIIEDKNYEG
ncbi:hypothetical protein [Dysosmobacter sp.]|uniref:hypothetical protein n=1 Tax=Dysosmobacter sp. TaxID=2591382 RepID=UPI002A88128B|nr:hypothetical protein [Dysosmobacter sp.]MDY3985942.1 hypothetical protein [Dysosmobacter sp.]